MWIGPNYYRMFCFLRDTETAQGVDNRFFTDRASDVLFDNIRFATKLSFICSERKMIISSKSSVHPMTAVSIMSYCSPVGVCNLS